MTPRLNASVLAVLRRAASFCDASYEAPTVNSDPSSCTPQFQRPGCSSACSDTGALHHRVAAVGACLWEQHGPAAAAPHRGATCRVAPEVLLQHLLWEFGQVACPDIRPS